MGTSEGVNPCWEIYGGYDYLEIGSVNVQGPVIGLRWWF
jgi:hypothetical protein